MNDIRYEWNDGLNSVQVRMTFCSSGSIVTERILRKNEKDLEVVQIIWDIPK